jgi:hypothetical protein
MRYMMMIKANKDYEAGIPPSPQLTEAIGTLAEELMKEGVLVDSGGLMPSSNGALVRVGGGALTVIDGPFPETKELIGGYAILDAGSKNEAIELGKRFMKVHFEILGPSYNGELEIRQMGGCGNVSKAEEADLVAETTRR